MIYIQITKFPYISNIFTYAFMRNSRLKKFALANSKKNLLCRVRSKILIRNIPICHQINNHHPYLEYTEIKRYWMVRWILSCIFKLAIHDVTYMTHRKKNIWTEALNKVFYNKSFRNNFGFITLILCPFSKKDGIWWKYHYAYAILNSAGPELWV